MFGFRSQWNPRRPQVEVDNLSKDLSPMLQNIHFYGAMYIYNHFNVSRLSTHMYIHMNTLLLLFILQKGTE